MKKMIACLVGGLLVGGAQASIVLIDNTETGGNGQFEFLGAKTSDNGWQSSARNNFYVNTATDQTGDTANDTIMPGWVLSNGGTFGLDSVSGKSTVGGDLGEMGQNHYLFSNGGHSGYAWSTVAMPMTEGNQLHIGFWLKNSGNTRVKVRLGSAPAQTSDLVDLYDTYVELGGSYYSGSGRYFNFDHTVTAADEAAGKTTLGFWLYTNTSQSYLDDVSVSYTAVPEPATLSLLLLVGGSLIGVRRLMM